jgi:ubiquinone/menaquinone biosynthesis C-methylase UbiE
MDLMINDNYYYKGLAAAFVRGRLGPCGGDDESTIQIGREQGLKIHKFKQTSLPRVIKVLGILRGLMPQSLLDVGSGRGAFLWPLLDGFRDTPITAIDISRQRVSDILAVRAGGIQNLDAQIMNVCQLEFPDNNFDVVTALEVIEHLEHPGMACSEIVRVARRFAILSVPSNPDNNPEHLQLFDKDILQTMIEEAGARSVNILYVLGHMIAVAKV